MTDECVVALAEHCPHLTYVYFGGCEQMTGVSVVALAEHCPQAEFYAAYVGVGIDRYFK